MKCGKTHFVLDLIEKEYSKYFDHIIIICPTLRYNNTYHSKEWIKKDDSIWLIEPPKYIIRRTFRNNKTVSEKVSELCYWIGNLSQMLACSEILFIIDDIIADVGIDKKRQSPLELATSDRHRDRYLWLLTQSYTAIPKDLRIQAIAIFVWYPKEKGDPKTIHDENNVLTEDELVVVRDLLKKAKHACLYTRKEYPRGFCVK